jgi:hypothetical protein
MLTMYFKDVHYIISQSSVPFIWVIRYRRADLAVTAIMDDYGNLVKIDTHAWAIAVANGVH